MKQNNSLSPVSLDNQRAVPGMFAQIAPYYDFLNHFFSLGLDIHWRNRLIKTLNPGPSATIVDLACGTLDVSLALQKAYPHTQILSTDLSLTMMIQGRKKDSSGRMKLICSDARSLCLKENIADNVLIAFGIRNILPRERAYKEILKTLKPGCSLHILEFGSAKKRIIGGIYNFYLFSLLPKIGKLVSKHDQAYTYLARTVAEFPPAEKLKRELLEAGFQKVSYQPLSMGIVYLHSAYKA